MSGRLGLYVNTVRYMKPGQIFRRIGKRLGMKCALPGAHPARHSGRGYLIPIPELDFDPVFLSIDPLEYWYTEAVTSLYQERM